MFDYIDSTRISAIGTLLVMIVIMGTPLFYDIIINLKNKE